MGPDKSEARYATPGTLAAGGSAAPVLNRAAQSAAGTAIEDLRGAAIHQRIRSCIRWQRWN